MQTLVIFKGLPIAIIHSTFPMDYFLHFGPKIKVEYATLAKTM